MLKITPLADNSSFVVSFVQCCSNGDNIDSGGNIEVMGGDSNSELGINGVVLSYGSTVSAFFTWIRNKNRKKYMLMEEI